nr:hypothetical protein [uncultured Methanoregula sp.]
MHVWSQLRDGEKEVLTSGSEILVVGCAITACKDLGHAADEVIGKRDRKEGGTGW